MVSPAWAGQRRENSRIAVRMSSSAREVRRVRPISSASRVAEASLVTWSMFGSTRVGAIAAKRSASSFSTSGSSVDSATRSRASARRSSARSACSPSLPALRTTSSSSSSLPAMDCSTSSIWRASSASAAEPSSAARTMSRRFATRRATEAASMSSQVTALIICSA